jgi:hypothetical protein
VVNSLEKGRYEEQAKLFEQMKEGAWTSLRRFKPDEIAIYLSYISKSNPKMAAKIMTAAQNDAEYPDIGMAIQRAMLTVDLEEKTGSQIERLAELYQWMQADAIVSSLRDSSAKEVAAILIAMESKADPTGKKRAAILTALQKENSQRELEVQRYLKEMTPAAPGASQ